jgi:hypothetical protein
MVGSKIARLLGHDQAVSPVELAFIAEGGEQVESAAGRK